MLLLDKPLVSQFVMNSIRRGLFPAFDTGCIVPEGELDLLGEEDAIARLTGKTGERIHTISENSISWIESQDGNERLKEKIRLFKDKCAFRDLTADLYPGLFYRKVGVDQLRNLDIAEIPFPHILKPNVGFFSMGVHKLNHRDKWEPTCLKIQAEIDHIRSIYPKAVLDTAEFIIEEVIHGEEYAIDAYYGAQGEPVLVGVMHHLFGGENDVSDRVYLTSSGIINRHKEIFMDFLEKIGQRAGLKNFSLHAEVRIDEQGRLVPIEINPLRFGAWCTSADLMHYAFGINPYHLYINNIIPDWDHIRENTSEDLFGIIILDNSTGIPGNRIRSFNYKKAVGMFSKVLELRPVDYRKYPIFGILFIQTGADKLDEIQHILQDDLKKLIKF
ncbi:MAG: ATP-grasp domain-containing protein [Bacteroidales bacterium]|jgi:hypothetical protein|nr:ATP-grasp domain-containing protein [Bacteroidales bacterium]